MTYEIRFTDRQLQLALIAIEYVHEESGIAASPASMKLRDVVRHLLIIAMAQNRYLRLINDAQYGLLAVALSFAASPKNPCGLSPIWRATVIDAIDAHDDARVED